MQNAFESFKFLKDIDADTLNKNIDSNNISNIIKCIIKNFKLAFRAILLFINDDFIQKYLLSLLK